LIGRHSFNKELPRSQRVADCGYLCITAILQQLRVERSLEDVRDVVGTTNRGLRVYRRGVNLRFIRPGKPIENADVESFNGKFREECLNEHWFASLPEARVMIEAVPNSGSRSPRVRLNS